MYDFGWRIQIGSNDFRYNNTFICTSAIALRNKSWSSMYSRSDRGRVCPLKAVDDIVSTHYLRCTLFYYLYVYYRYDRTRGVFTGGEEVREIRTPPINIHLIILNVSHKLIIEKKKKKLKHFSRILFTYVPNLLIMPRSKTKLDRENYLHPLSMVNFHKYAYCTRT